MLKWIKDLAYLSVHTLWMDPKPQFIIQNLAAKKSITSTDSCSGKKFLTALEEIGEGVKSRLEA